MCQFVAPGKSPLGQSTQTIGGANKLGKIELATQTFFSFSCKLLSQGTILQVIEQL